MDAELVSQQVVIRHLFELIQLALLDNLRREARKPAKMFPEALLEVCERLGRIHLHREGYGAVRAICLHHGHDELLRLVQLTSPVLAPLARPIAA